MINSSYTIIPSYFQALVVRCHKNRNSFPTKFWWTRNWGTSNQKKSLKFCGVASSLATLLSSSSFLLEAAAWLINPEQAACRPGLPDFTNSAFPDDAFSNSFLGIIWKLYDLVFLSTSLLATLLQRVNRMNIRFLRKKIKNRILWPPTSFRQGGRREARTSAVYGELGKTGRYVSNKISLVATWW